MKPALLSLVEHGWQSARVLSIAVAQRLHAPVTHYIKGAVPREVLEMIAPYPGMRISPIARRWFRVVVAVAMLMRLLRGAVLAIIVDNERTRRWVQALAKRWRVPVIVACEEQRQLSYQLQGEVVGQDILLARLKRG